MTKISTPKKYQKKPEFNLIEFMAEDSPTDETVASMMGSFMTAHYHQQQIAVELTKLIIENDAAKPTSAETIFATFKQACQVIEEASPMKDFWEKLNNG